MKYMKMDNQQKKDLLSSLSLMVDAGICKDEIVKIGERFDVKYSAMFTIENLRGSVSSSKVRTDLKRYFGYNKLENDFSAAQLNRFVDSIAVNKFVTMGEYDYFILGNKIYLESC